ncbi:alpha/beta hydrolase, partial [Candidatus Woesearchaeota archaeon]|nr:alpha/beta hydrolase [Candidatus Woesearchaeota archaeon]
FDGTEINYIVNKGKEPWLIFIHGGGSNHTVWKPFFSYFKRHSFIAVDIRGHGKSEKGKISCKNFSKDLKKIFDKEKIEKAVILGNSFGATIAIDFYRKFPGLVEKLVLITPVSTKIIRFSKLFYLLNKIILPFVKLFKSRRRLVFQDYYKFKIRFVIRSLWLDIKGTSLTMYLSSIDALFNYDLRFENIQKKTLMILGKKDYLTKKQKIKKMIKNNNNIILRIIDSNHLPLTRAPEKVIKEVKKFI